MSSRMLVVAVVASAAAYAATPVLLPAFVALVMAALVAPIAGWLRRLGLARGAAASIAVTLALAGTLMAGWGCYYAIAGVVRQAPQYSEKIRDAARSANARLRALQRRAIGLSPQGGPKQEPEPKPSAPARDWTSILLRGLGSFVEAAGLAVFVPFLALFLLIEQPRLEAAFDRAAGRGYDAARLREEGARVIRAYIFGNLALGAVLSVIQWGLFAAVGLDNAAGLGLVTGFLNVIPVLGLPLALLLPLAQGLGSFHAAWPFALVGGSLLAIHLTAANWVIPKTIGSRVRVNATAGTLGMLFFGWLWGIVGFLLAVPLTALVKVGLECSAQTAPLGGLLADAEEK